MHKTTVDSRTSFRQRLAATASLAALLLVPGHALAQRAIEMNSTGASTAAAAPFQGPLTITFQNNTDNPGGNTFAAVGATTPTATLTILNQQFANGTNFTTNGAMIGGTFAGDPHYAAMNFLGGGQSAQFTSLPTVAAGTGIAVATNHAAQFEFRTNGLLVAAAPANGRFQFADLQVDLNVPVSNLVLHIAGLGGTAGGKGFTAEFDLVPGSSIGATGITRLSGNAAFGVAGNQISHLVATPAADCAVANSGACGSIRVTGTAITRVYLRMYMRASDGVAWPNNGAEGWMLGISGEVSDMTPVFSGLPASIVPGTNYAATLTCTNQGPNIAYSPTCTPTASAGTISALNCVPAIPVAPAGLSPIAPNNQLACSFNYVLPPGGGQTQVTFTGQTGAVNDRNGGSVGTAPNNQVIANVPVPNADLVLTKTNTPGVNGNVDQAADTVVSGAPSNYAITVTNNGPDAANGAVVTDPVPTNLTCATATCSAAGGAVCPAQTGAALVAALQGAGATVPTLPNAGSVTFTLNCTVQ
jgi:uncharacterized repeat protein (TIGR01451 family)